MITGNLFPEKGPMTRSNARLLLLAISGLAALFAVTLVAAQSTSTATVEVRVWRLVDDPERLHLSTRPAGGRWVTHRTPLNMRELSRSGLWHQSSIIAVDVEVPAAVPAELSGLHGIDDSTGCAALLALVAEHLAESVSVTSCEGVSQEDWNYVRGILVHRGNRAAFVGIEPEAGRLTTLSWTLMTSSPFFPSACFNLTRQLRETYDFARWDCMTRVFVENLAADEGDPALVWNVIGELQTSTGTEWGYVAQVPDGESEPTSLVVTGPKRSRFHGIDHTPECAGVVAFVAEHFAETTSITSCEGQTSGSGSLRGLLEHRGEAAYFDGRWNEEEGITRLNWTPVRTFPIPPMACGAVREWLAEHEGLTEGVCEAAEASVQFRSDGVGLDWLVTGDLGSGDGEVVFEAWAVDGESRPYVYRLSGPLGAWEYVQAE
jgi:hypothetical protein